MIGIGVPFFLVSHHSCTPAGQNVVTLECFVGHGVLTSISVPVSDTKVSEGSQVNKANCLTCGLTYGNNRFFLEPLYHSLDACNVSLRHVYK